MRLMNTFHFTEVAVYKYCNADIDVPVGEGGFLKSPGYPLYYVGGFSCGWTFRSQPGQRILLTFHDLNLRGELHCYKRSFEI